MEEAANFLSVIDNVFLSMRLAGVRLGIDDYLAVATAIESGIGVGDETALSNLCTLLWAKSNEEGVLLRRLLTSSLNSTRPRLQRGKPAARVIEGHISAERTLAAILPTTSKVRAGLEVPAAPDSAELADGGKTTREAPAAGSEDHQPERQSKLAGNLRLAASTQESVLVHTDDEVEVAEYRSAAQLRNSSHSNSSQKGDYVPITARQLKQTWRYLRMPLTVVAPGNEIDIHGTVDAFSRHGVVTELSPATARTNRAALLLLLDQGGSMAPFAAHSRRLIETAARGGRFDRVNTLFFHNGPAEYLFIDEARQSGVPVEDVLADAISASSRVLIFSDGGAARGGHSLQRLLLTRRFLEKLGLGRLSVAWVNPMPRARWAGTTAEDIGGLVPMFELSRRGMEGAVKSLRSRSVRVGQFL